MTTPEERHRNPVWRLETLNELGHDDASPTAWRREAARLSDCPPLARQSAGAADLAALQGEFVP